ncbi:FimB/Mfa2 family fimbrial subunit [Xylanibacter brevis]|uniref:FimB/Mfa2 family fimbrial subunit n=1 Tax=Xylanibacter brevis TaxID=83231 RepID=UPI0009DDC48F|nr:FimB/Mfa2 family fimbrial subunit [Xylanibacter brevis]
MPLTSHFSLLISHLAPKAHSSLILRLCRTISHLAPKAHLLLLVLLASSCEKPIYDEVGAGQDPNGNLVLHIAFDDTRAGQTVCDYFGTINFVIYQEGSKVSAFTQHPSSGDYGNLSVYLEPGEYQVMALAHSAKANPTLAHANEIYFANKDGFSDTFCYYGDVTVTSEPKQYTLQLARVSSCVRFIIEDEIPASVNTMLFQYTGGSGTLNAETGYGCKNSQQYMEFTVDHNAKPPYVFDIYTMLKSEEGELNFTVFGVKKNGTTRVNGRQTDFTVAIHRQEMVELSGNFFTEETPNGGDDHPGEDPIETPSDSTSFVMVVDTVWHQVTHLTY